MSINNVIVKDNHGQCFDANGIPFELTMGETVVYRTTSKRQSLSISLQGNLPVHIRANDGYIYVTNKRLIFITASSGDINSFLMELTYTPMLQFSHQMKSPWFGPNYYEFLFVSNGDPTMCDGFPKDEWFKGEIRFNDGGLFQFVESFNHCLNDAINNSHIDDQLPSYSPV